jgi:hypothetical protein
MTCYDMAIEAKYHSNKEAMQHGHNKARLLIFNPRANKRHLLNKLLNKYKS